MPDGADASAARVLPIPPAPDELRLSPFCAFYIPSRALQTDFRSILHGWAVWFAALGLCATPIAASAECRDVSHRPADASAYVLHLSDSCTPPEREARAVPAGALLEALRQGKGIDLVGVVVRGDLFLDELAPVPLDRIQGVSEAVRDAWIDLSGSPASVGRVIAGPLSIQRSLVKGAIATRLSTGALLVKGPVTMRETIFEAPQDWSRTVFAAPVDWTGARFQREGFFLRCKFLGDVRFDTAQFGPHTRFHRAEFWAPVSFVGGRFQGLTEFLEVVFHHDVSFARARFEQGTGFSGSRFGGTAVFSEAEFEREAFLLFARFEGAAQFQHARFQEAAEFGEARFEQRADFTGAEFRHPPQWNRVTFKAERVLPDAAGTDWLNYGIMLGAGLVALALFWVILRF